MSKSYSTKRESKVPQFHKESKKYKNKIADWEEEEYPTFIPIKKKFKK